MRSAGILLLLCCVNVYATASPLEQYAEVNRARAAGIIQLDNSTILAEEARLAPLASDLLLKVKPMIREGGSGAAIQRYVLTEFERYGWLPMLVGYNGYTAAVPVSVNSQVGTAPPTATPFPKAALVKVELVGASPKAYVAQVWTFATAMATEQQRQLLATARSALRSGIDQVRAGERLSNVGQAIQEVLDANQAVAIHEFSGYAMGQSRIQKPQVLGYKDYMNDATLMQSGQVLNVYVIAKAGEFGVRFQPPDFWTIHTKDGADGVMLSAMVQVTDDGHRLLSRLVD